MKTKVMASVLAGVMGVQSTAMATSRVDAVGEKQIAEGAAELATMEQSLVDLDGSLQMAYDQINLKKENLEKGTLERFLTTGGYSFALAGAAVGVIGGAMSTARVGGGVGLIILGSVGSGLTAVSSLMSMLTHTDSAFNHVDVSEARSKLDKASSDTANAIKVTRDPVLKSQLEQLEISLNRVNDSLASYKSDENIELGSRITTELIQAAGVAVAVYGMTAPGGGSEKALKIGAVVQAVGNLLTVMDLASNDQIEQVLLKISIARLATQNALLLK